MIDWLIDWLSRRQSVCSFTGFLPDVCCGDKPVFGEETTTTTTETTTTTITETTTTEATSVTTETTTTTPGNPIHEIYSEMPFLGGKLEKHYFYSIEKDIKK